MNDEEFILDFITRLVQRPHIYVDVERLRRCMQRHRESMIEVQILDALSWFDRTRGVGDTYHLIVHLDEDSNKDWVGAREEKEGRLLHAYRVWWGPSA